MTDEEAIQSAQSIHAQGSSPIQNTPVEWSQWLKSMNLDSAAQHPIGQVGLTLVKDPAFRQAYSEVQQGFQLNLTLGYLGAWILIIWILRAWRMSKADTWLTRIWTQLWVSILSWRGILFLIPGILWGKSYQMLLATAFRAVIHQFWT